MSRASDKGKDTAEGKTHSVGSLASDEEAEEDSGDDMEDAGREETPDLYRNSSLGMCVVHIFFLLFMSDHVNHALLGMVG